MSRSRVAAGSSTPFAILLMVANLFAVVVGCSGEPGAPSTGQPGVPANTGHDAGAPNVDPPAGHDAGAPPNVGTDGSEDAGVDAAVVCASDLSACVLPTEPECRVVGCTAGKCVYTNVPMGTAVSSAGQIIGDCKRRVCDGLGASTAVPDDNDVPVGANECTINTCAAGSVQTTPAADGKTCPTGSCKAGLCVPPSCLDGKKNGNETGVDCGSSCPACPAHASCAVPADCQSGVCTGGICQVPSCSDGVKNGGEPSTDCGGPCGACPAGRTCAGPVDCQSGVCTAATCQAPTCSDGVKNGGETGSDCGGPCGACPTGQGCAAATDCQSRVCSGGSCQAASCSDGVKNGGETGLDCGGACPGCLAGGTCTQGKDCASGVCTAGICQAPTCTDGVKNGAESGVDCGPGCSPCGFGNGCIVDSDCSSGACQAGRCAYSRFMLDAPLANPIAGGFHAFAVAHGDFNGDGKRDAAIAIADGVSVFLGQGDGTFASPVYYPTDATAVDLVSGDLDGDGRSDLVVVNGGILHATTTQMSVLLTGGAASFAKTNYTLNGRIRSVALGDLDRDGKLDVIAGTTTEVRVFYNQGNGSLVPGVSLAWGAASVATADVNGDGRLDLLALLGDNDVYLELRVVHSQSNGAFSAPVIYQGNWGSRLVAGDIDSDGRPDVITTSFGQPAAMLNRGGTFVGPRVLPLASTKIKSIALEDMNSDGKLDVVLATEEVGYNMSPSVEVATNVGNGQFASAGTHPVDDVYGVGVGDFDGDCKPDIVTATARNGLSVLLGDGLGGYPTTTRIGIVGEVTTVADLDGDGRPDTASVQIYGNFDPVSLMVDWNATGPGRGTPTAYPLGGVNNARDVIASDVNGDGRLDIIVAQDLSDRIVVLLNQGNRSFAAPAIYPTCSRPKSLAAADVSGDGKPDIVVACNGVKGGDGKILVKRNAGNGTFVDGFQASLPYNNAIAVGDLNGDGRPDLAVAQIGGVRVLSGDSNGGFPGSGVFFATGNGASSVVIADLDGDGTRDIAATNIDEATVSVLRNAGASFLDPEDYFVPRSPGRIAAGDLDGDGRPDLAISGSETNTLTVLRNHAGFFPERVDFGAWFAPRSLSIIDMNGDGMNDVVVDGTGPLSILHNISGRRKIPCPTCGDGIVAAPEVCDDGALFSGDGCSAVCKLELGFACVGAPSVCGPVCGDTVIAGGETCDDGNTSNSDACDATCHLEQGWECTGAPSVCQSTCGDGIVVGTETCDDGNRFDGDTCPSTCRPELWSRTYGNVGSQQTAGVVVDGAGAPVIVGYFDGTIDFGGGALQTAGSYDVFVAKLDGAGNSLWSRRAGDAGDQRAQGVAVDASGNVVVTGFFSGSIDFGGGSLVSAGSYDIFVVKLDSAGNHLWSKRFGDSAQQQGSAVAVDGSGNVFLTGVLRGTADFGGGAMTSAGQGDIFVAKLDADGNHLWSRHFGDAANQSATSIAVSASGDAFITGACTGTVDFGGGPLAALGASDTFLLSLDSAGQHRWSKRWGAGNQYQQGSGVAVDGAGNVLVTGAFQGVTNLGTGVLTSAGKYDIFLGKLSAAGVPLFARRYGSPESDWGAAVTSTGGGNVLLTGYHEGPVDFGTGSPSPSGLRTAFVAKLDAACVTVWSGSYGTSSTGGSIAADALGNVFAAGNFQGSIDFSGGSHSSAGADDVYLVKLAP